MNNELNTVEDIDAMLDSQFNITDTADVDVDNEETDGDAISADTEEDENLSSEENESIENDDENSTNENTEEQSSYNKPCADDKNEFAFSKIRKENSDLKNQLNQKNEESDFLSRMAAQYGYTDIKKFQADYEKARIEQEAKRITAELSVIQDSFNKFFQEFLLLGKHISNANGKYDELTKKAEKLNTQMENVIQIKD